MILVWFSVMRWRLVFAAAAVISALIDVYVPWFDSHMQWTFWIGAIGCFVAPKHEPYGAKEDASIASECPREDKRSAIDDMMEKIGSFLGYALVWGFIAWILWQMPPLYAALLILFSIVMFHLDRLGKRIDEESLERWRDRWGDRY